MQSPPNALDFGPNKDGVAVRVPKGSDKVFAPYSGWFTFVEDYDDPNR